MKRGHWSEEEIKYLKENYSKLGAIKCSEILDRKTSNVSIKAFKLNIKITKEDKFDLYSNFNPDEFLKINIPEIIYILGLIWADGNVDKKSNRISVGLVENDFNDIKNIFIKTGNWNFITMHPKNRKRITYARIGNKKIHNFLTENDYLIKSGSSANKILSKIPEELKHYWWRGYFDGDGWFSYKKSLKYNSGISSCYNQNWDFIEKLFQKLNIRYFITNRIRENGGSSDINISNYNGTKIFGDYIYQGIQFGLSRKLQKFKDMQINKES